MTSGFQDALAAEGTARAAARAAADAARAGELEHARRDLQQRHADAGGLLRLSTVAGILRTSRQRAELLVAREDFPPPVEVDGVRHWVGAEVELWQRAIGKRRRPGRPRRPRAEGTEGA